MADRSTPGTPRHIEVKHEDRTVAEAVVSGQPGGTARASLYPPSGHVPAESRARLVDAVVEAPEVRQSTRLEAALPLGDSVALQRLRERTEEESTRPAGSTALVDATLPDPGQPDAGQPGGGPAPDPDGAPPAG